MLDYLTTRIRLLLEDTGVMTAEAIAVELGVPLGNVRVLLMCRKCFGCRNGRWGLRDENAETEMDSNVTYQ